MIRRGQTLVEGEEHLADLFTEEEVRLEETLEDAQGPRPAYLRALKPQERWERYGAEWLIYGQCSLVEVFDAYWDDKIVVLTDAAEELQLPREQITDLAKAEDLGLVELRYAEADAFDREMRALYEKYGREGLDEILSPEQRQDFAWLQQMGLHRGTPLPSTKDEEAAA